jgi:ankyrin repeat protein
MLSFYNPYLRIQLLILLLSVPAGLFSQIMEIDTTAELNTPLTLYDQSNMNYFLMFAASKGDVPLINWLIRNGAEVNSETDENVTPLMFAVANNMTEAVNALLKYHADVNIVPLNSESPLLAAVKNDNLDIAEALIRDSADINFSDRYGATPLHYASIYGYFYLADMLLYYNADKDIKSKDGTTPLMAAIWSGFADITDILIQNGANCEEKDTKGFTPLMLAAQNGDTIIMEMLLKKGINIYETNNYRYNALDVLIRSGHKEAIEYLFRKGYKWDTKLSNAMNPYSVAAKYSRKNIIRVLEKNQIPENRHFGFNQVAVTASVRLSQHDYFTGMNLVFKEPYINGGLIAGFDFKPLYTRVLVKIEDNLFYQYQDESSVAYGGIFKDIPLTDHPLKANWLFTSSVVAAYNFGNKLKGTNIAPENKFKVIPSVGFKWSLTNFSISGNLDYMKTEFYKIGPVWLRLGIAYNIFLDNDRASGKNIKWY